MNKKQYESAKDALMAQLEAAERVVEFYEEQFMDKVPENIREYSFDVVSTAWNAAHDMVSGIRGAIELLNHDYRVSKIPASEMGTYELVQQNID